MNGRSAANSALLKALVSEVDEALAAKVDICVCPPSVYIGQVADALSNAPIMLGAQNVSEYRDGAYTGEVSAEMLADTGCEMVIVGHSERRELFAETDEQINAKVKAALEADLSVIVCVGETEQQRKSGRALEVVSRQVRIALSEVASLENVIVAYEPIWAIGTGQTATPDQAQEVHAAIRQVLEQIFGKEAAETRLLYGGSVKPGNAAELFAQADIDGGLIGGASLKDDEFLAICTAGANSNG